MEGGLTENNNNLNNVKDYKKVSYSKESKRAWPKLIQKIFEVGPLICPMCRSEIKIVVIIQNKSAIEKIINYLEKKRAPPEVKMFS